MNVVYGQLLYVVMEIYAVVSFTRIYICNLKPRLFIKVKKVWPKHCVYLDHLQSSVMNYLNAIKVVSQPQQDLYSITERELLINRLSRIIDIEQPNLKICPNHRFSYGTGWSIPQNCVYSKEDGTICHLRSDRVAPMHLIKSLSTFPYGGKICATHRDNLYQNDAITIAATNPVSDIHSWEMIADDADPVNDVLVMLEQSPIKSRATQIPIQDQAPGSQRRLVSKFRKYCYTKNTVFRRLCFQYYLESLCFRIFILILINSRVV
jgi:hypothetical protein